MLTTTTSIAGVLELAALYAIPTWTVLNDVLFSFPYGPYSALFASLFLFHYSVPSTYSIRLFKSITISDKTLLYILTTHLLLLRPTSAFHVLTGLMSAIIWRKNVLGLGKWRFPAFLRRWTWNVVKLCVGGDEQVLRRRARGGRRDQRATEMDDLDAMQMPRTYASTRRPTGNGNPATQNVEFSSDSIRVCEYAVLC